MYQDEARRLRRDEGLSIAQIQQRLGVSKQTLTGWLRGVPAPAWTARPNAKDDLRARAVELRAAGWSVNDIALDLGVARSTAWQWVRHLPLDPESDRARMKRQKGKDLTDGRWARHRVERDEARRAAMSMAASEIATPTRHDLLLVGAAIYWCEGRKSKPWRRDDRVVFTNSDPGLIALFLRFVRLCGWSPADLQFRVAIHESADAFAAEAWWKEALGLPDAEFDRATLKRHKPLTTRHNLGDDYHGCLVVTVPRSRDLYWRIEGIMAGLVGAGMADVTDGQTGSLCRAATATVIATA